uniref:Uncharacterized protein n=1 Tax=Peronospora matthiolae TaxID=2874970 RepID=A0AAV1TC88_9STRA
MVPYFGPPARRATKRITVAPIGSTDRPSMRLKTVLSTMLPAHRATRLKTVPPIGSLARLSTRLKMLPPVGLPAHLATSFKTVPPIGSPARLSTRLKTLMPIGLHDRRATSLIFCCKRKMCTRDSSNSWRFQSKPLQAMPLEVKR